MWEQSRYLEKPDESLDSVLSEESGLAAVILICQNFNSKRRFDLNTADMALD